MFYFQLLAVVAVFAVIALLATGRGGGVGDTYADRPDVALPDDRQLRKTDVDAVRFTLGWRGYRMEEVDLVLDRLASEIEARDARIAELSPHPVTVVAGVEYEPVRSAEEAGGTGSEAVVDQGSAEVSGEAVRTETPAEGGSPDENPLSAWYHKPE